MNRKTLVISVVALTTGVIVFISTKRDVYAGSIQWRSLIKEVSFPGVSHKLVEAVIWVESRGDPDVIGDDGEVGLMQILPSTALDMGYSTFALADPYVNIKAGSNYLKNQLDRYGGDMKDAVAAYNAGSAMKNNYGEYVNQDYVDKVMSAYWDLILT